MIDIKAKLYRKKPVVVEAIQWTGNNLHAVTEFRGQQVTPMHPKWDEYTQLVELYGLKIRTLEGEMSANVGDFIIKGVNGEFYPCKPDIFEKTYEAVE